MEYFKTKAGTALPLIQLKGKDYLQVAHRLVWVREEHPDWSIETEFVTLTETYAIAKATIKDQTGKVLANGHKREDQKHFADFSEKAETGAIGRALALCGYGTQFAPDLDEGDRLADSPVDRPKQTEPWYPPKEEKTTPPSENPFHPAEIPTKEEKKQPEISMDDWKIFGELSKKQSWTKPMIKRYCEKAYNIGKLTDISKADFDKLCHVVANIPYGEAISSLQTGLFKDGDELL